jgi:DNA-binding transcriptional LysR family regulator
VSIQNLNRGVQSIEHGADATHDGRRAQHDWRDVSYFLACAEVGSFKRGAEAAGCSINTLRTHIERLERRLGKSLFRRSHFGLMLTEAGAEFLRVAEDMRAAGTDAQSDNDARAFSFDSHEIRVDITEGLGSFWLTPRLHMLLDDGFEAMLTLHCRAGLETLSRRPTDIAVQLERPVDSAMICVRLGTLHLMPFASRGYIDRHGKPTSMQQALSHKLVVQVSPKGRHDVFALLVGDTPRPGMITAQTNASSAYYSLVSQGAGIGMLPTYVAALTDALEPIEMELKLRTDIWMVYHPDLRHSVQARKAIAWIRQSFDAQKYPWFGDEFIHPDNFKA